MPPPIPVPSVTITAFSAPRAAPAFHSPKAAMVASFSTCTEIPSCSRNCGPTGTLKAPGMFGEAFTTPSGVMRPGTPIPNAVVPPNS